MSWERPYACRRCDHPFGAHVIGEPGEAEAGWMLCTGRRCSCWHEWPAVGDVGVLVNSDVSTKTLERERRQLQLILHTIVDFRRGEIPISRAIHELDAVASELVLTPAEFRENFSYSLVLNGLELPYAIALDRSTPIPDATDPEIAGVIDELQQMAARHLATVVALDRADPD